MAGLFDFGKELFAWNHKKDQNQAAFIVDVSAVLVDDKGITISFRGTVTSDAQTIGKKVEFVCAGNFRDAELSGGNFPPPGEGVLAWTCQDVNSKGNIHGPKGSDILRYDLTDFELVDGFLLARAKEHKVGSHARAVIRFSKAITSKT